MCDIKLNRIPVKFDLPKPETRTCPVCKNRFRENNLGYVWLIGFQRLCDKCALKESWRLEEDIRRESNGMA